MDFFEPVVAPTPQEVYDPATIPTTIKIIKIGRQSANSPHWFPPTSLSCHAHKSFRSEFLRLCQADVGCHAECCTIPGNIFHPVLEVHFCSRSINSNRTTADIKLCEECGWVVIWIIRSNKMLLNIARNTDAQIRISKESQAIKQVLVCRVPGFATHLHGQFKGSGTFVSLHQSIAVQ